MSEHESQSNGRKGLPAGEWPNFEESMREIAGTDSGIVKLVGEDSVAIITRLNPTGEQPEYVGNILRRTCQAAGAVSCRAECQLRSGSPGVYRSNPEKQCADANLRDALYELGIEDRDVLMVAVTGDKVGYGDRLVSYGAQDEVARNPEGWREIAGYNAFFARPDEVPAIGSRLADCAHFAFDFKDSEGEDVIGFEHGTRPNMTGRAAYKFEVDGVAVSYTHYVLANAIRHYGADPKSFSIRLSSSIQAHNFVKHFGSAEQMEGHVPGWYGDGFVRNVTNPDWKPGDAFVETDEWYADARGLILRDAREAMQALGIKPEQLQCDDMLDPADTNGEFSSYERRAEFGDYRDLYLVAHNVAFTC